MNVFINQRSSLSKSKLLKKSMSPFQNKVYKTKVDDEYQIMKKNIKKTEIVMDNRFDIYKRKHSEL